MEVVILRSHLGERGRDETIVPIINVEDDIFLNGEDIMFVVLKLG